MCDDRKFPPTPSKKYVNLTTVYYHHNIEKVMEYTLHGNVEQLLEGRKKIDIKDILTPIWNTSERLRLVIIEGPPGVGKSTLSWELCRKWDEIPHMSQYSLVVLLRLRENSVQPVKTVADLFYHVDSDLQQSVAKEVVTTEGKGVLFILDGFDELPSDLRHDGLLIDLITGRALPKSTVIVATRPSATASLLRSCRPQVQKCVEILGFTQGYVKEYASSVFSSERKLLDDFLTYISASKNPAINSLMYIPLNAAIVVEVYRNSRRTGGPIPKTLTQLYTQLCLTLIQRHLNNEKPDIILNRFTDLTENDSHHFLKLSEIAFQGFKKAEAVFSLPRKLVHFGFLDVVPSLLGGGGDSHNFLHFTVQEFLAAYYIFQLSNHEGLEVFKQYGSDERWNMVWRFVAGLTGFEFFKSSVINSEAFVTTKTEGPQLSCLLIQCLYEAQISEFDYATTFGSTKILTGGMKTPLEKYALGCCIASSVPTASWHVKLCWGSTSSLIWGLRSKEQCRGIISTMHLSNCLITADFEECPNILHSLDSLVINARMLSKDTLSYLAKSIPSLHKLNTLEIILAPPKLYFSYPELFTVLHQLSDSKVSNLSIRGLKFYRLDIDHFSSALSKLIHPSSGKLAALTIGQSVFESRHTYGVEGTPKTVCTLLFGSSSLQKLHITYLVNPTHLTLLAANKCITHLTLKCRWTEELARSIAHVLQKNTTLQHLRLGDFHEKATNLLVIITCEMKMNTVLKKMELLITEDMKPEEYLEFNSDSRTYIELITKRSIPESHF